MSHTVDIAPGHKTRGLVVFLLIASDLGVRAGGCPHSLAPSSIKYGSVAQEKEPAYEILPDLDARSSDA